MIIEWDLLRPMGISHEQLENKRFIKFNYADKFKHLDLNLQAKTARTHALRQEPTLLPHESPRQPSVRQLQKLTFLVVCF